MPSWNLWFLLIVSLAATHVNEPGLVSWDPLYPRTGKDRGTIEVKGYVTLNKGWRVVGKTVKVEAFINGCVAHDFDVPIKNNVWGEGTIGGLVPTEVYVCTVAVLVTNGRQTETLEFIGPEAIAR